MEAPRRADWGEGCMSAQGLERRACGIVPVPVCTGLSLCMCVRAWRMSVVHQGPGAQKPS